MNVEIHSSELGREVEAFQTLGAARVERRRPRRGRKRLVFCAVVLIAAGLAYYQRHRLPQIASYLSRLTARSGGPAAPPGGRAVPVVTAIAREGDMDIYLRGLGTVTAFNTVTVRARVDGQINKVNFIEGQLVHENRDMLFEIDSRPFEVQRDQAQGQLARDLAQLENAKLDVDRYKIAEEAISQQQLATARATVAQFKGAVKTDQALIDNASLQITYCNIVAPITGTIGLRSPLVDVGNMVHASDSSGMAVITQLQPIAVRFSLSEDTIPQFIDRVKNGTQLPVEAYDRSNQRNFAVGSLVAADSQIDETTGMLRLKARFENEDGTLFPNQFVNVRLLVDTRRSTVLVPNAAIQPSQKSTFVYVVKPGEERTVQLRPVVCGPSEGAQTSIDSGLAAGEEVVIDGVDKLQEGTKVIIAAPTTRPGAGPATASTSRPASTP